MLCFSPFVQWIGRIYTGLGQTNTGFPGFSNVVGSTVCPETNEVLRTVHEIHVLAATT